MSNILNERSKIVSKTYFARHGIIGQKMVIYHLPRDTKNFVESTDPKMREFLREYRTQELRKGGMKLGEINKILEMEGYPEVPKGVRV